MQSILNNYNADVLMLDRIQTLFNPELGIDALQVIKKVSEEKPLRLLLGQDIMKTNN